MKNLTPKIFLSDRTGKYKAKIDSLESHQEIFSFLISKISEEKILTNANRITRLVKTSEIAIDTCQKFGLHLFGNLLCDGNWLDSVADKDLENFLSGVAEKLGMDHSQAFYHSFKRNLLKQLRSASIHKVYGNLPDRKSYFGKDENAR